MNNAVRWQYLRAIGVLLIVFIVGGIFGGLGTLYFLKRKLQSLSHPHETSKLMMSRLNSAVSLTPEEKQHIQPICDKLANELAQTMAAGAEQRRDFIQHVEDEISPELTPDQRERLHQAILKIQDKMGKKGGQLPSSLENKP